MRRFSKLQECIFGDEKLQWKATDFSNTEECYVQRPNIFIFNSFQTQHHTITTLLHVVKVTRNCDDICLVCGIDT